MRKVPVTILTGHLGAGKTTLLRRLLTNDLGKRIAVIENEFGNEVGIERLLAGTTLSEDSVMRSEDLFVELSNGCVCCSVKDTLVSTLETLLERSRDRIDHIVVETTGLADPGPLAGIFWLDDELESELILDGVLTVVDVANLESRLNSQANEALLQIAYADHIVLNKKDLLSDEQVDHVRQRVRKINPTAPILSCKFGMVDLSFCLDIKAFDSSRLRLHALPGNELTDAQVVHDKGITSMVIKNSHNPIDLDKLRSLIASMLWEPPEGLEVFRIKGVLWSKQDPSRVHTIQAVHKIFDMEKLGEEICWKDVDFGQPITKMVIIGNIPDKNGIEREFERNWS